MKKVVPQEIPIAVGSQLSTTSVESLLDSPVDTVLTASRKKLALLTFSTTFPESLQLGSLEDAEGVDDYHIIRLSALQQTVRLFSCCGSPLTVGV